MNRRIFVFGGLVAAGGVAGAYAWRRFRPLPADIDLAERPFVVADVGADAIDWRALTEDDWRARLSAEAFDVMRRHGTEPPGTSPLDHESRDGVFHCAGCDLALFRSQWKFDSGTGWPSFWDAIPDALGFSMDQRLWYPRIEYHCARCLGHQGHVFEDGPPPTGLRYCNNGVALVFHPGDGSSEPA